MAADDVVVGRLAAPEPEPGRRAHGAVAQELPASLVDRYPYLSEPPRARRTRACSRARLEAARGPRRALSVTLDARALDGAITGTQVHILELILALARTESLRLRAARARGADRPARRLSCCKRLPATEILAAESARPDDAAKHHLPPPAADLLAGRRRAGTDARRAVRAQPARSDRVSQPRLFRRRRRMGGLPSREPPRPLGRRAGGRLLRSHPSRAALGRARRGGAHQDRGPRPRPPQPRPSPAAPAALDDDPTERLSRTASCSAWARTSATRTGSSRCACSRRCANGTTGRGRLVLAGTHIPHGSSLELERAFLEEHAELREAVLSLGPVSEEEKAWLHRPRRRRPVPVGVRGVRPRAVRVGAAGRALRVRTPVLAGRGRRPTGTATILPWDPDASAAAAYALLTDAMRPRAPRGGAGRAGARADVGVRGRRDGRDLPRGGARAGARRRTLSRDAAQRESAAERRARGRREQPAGASANTPSACTTSSTPRSASGSA